MTYIEANLLKDEKVIYFTRVHWVIFVMPAFLLLAAFLFAIFGGRLFPGYVPFVRISLQQVVVLICVLSAIFSAISTFIRYVTSEYGITNKRILLKTGWIRRNSLELLLDKLEAIYVDQSIPGRLLDYGTLRIVGTGGTQDPFFYVPNPLKFRRIAQQEVDYEEHPPGKNRK